VPLILSNTRTPCSGHQSLVHACAMPVPTLFIIPSPPMSHTHPWSLNPPSHFTPWPCWHPLHLSPSSAIPMLPYPLHHSPMSLMPCQTSSNLSPFVKVPHPLSLTLSLSSIIPPSHTSDICIWPIHHYYFVLSHCLVLSFLILEAPLSAIMSVGVLPGICHIFLVFKAFCELSY